MLNARDVVYLDCGERLYQQYLASKIPHDKREIIPDISHLSDIVYDK